jgi:hypothetical protein
MPKPALVTGQDVYVLDPDNALIQYRARILLTSTDGAEASLAIYPDPDTQPDFESLPAQYRITLPASAVLTIPSITATITSYHAMLKLAKVPDETIAWRPAQAPVSSPIQAAATIPSVETAKVTARPAATDAFPLKIAGASVPVVAPAAPASAPPPIGPIPVPASHLPPPPLTGPTQPWAASLTPGTLLRVLPNELWPFWHKLAGKEAIFRDASPGDNGTVFYHVEIEGGMYNDADSRRFELASGAGASVPGAAPSAAPTDPVAAAAAMVGQVVAIACRNGQKYNVQLNAADAAGITILGDKRIAWEQVTALQLMTPALVPGSKEAAKADKAAAKAMTATPAALAVSPSTPNPATALAEAHQAVSAALNGGKVTRKVLEGVLPLLISAQQYQVTLEARAPAAPATPDIQEADGVVQRAREAFGEVHKLVLKLSGRA